MRFLMWILTITFTLTGLTLRADGGFLAGTPFLHLAPWLVKGSFLLAILACPFLWARPDGLVPETIAIPGRHRLTMALALILAAPLILPWPF